MRLALKQEERLFKKAALYLFINQNWFINQNK